MYKVPMLMRSKHVNEELFKLHCAYTESTVWVSFSWQESCTHWCKAAALSILAVCWMSKVKVEHYIVYCTSQKEE